LHNSTFDYFIANTFTTLATLPRAILATGKNYTIALSSGKLSRASVKPENKVARESQGLHKNSQARSAFICSARVLDSGKKSVNVWRCRGRPRVAGLGCLVKILPWADSGVAVGQDRFAIK
jgi:hypothetical protein